MNLKILTLSFAFLCFVSCKKSSDAVTSTPQLNKETAIDTVSSSSSQKPNLPADKTTEVKKTKKASVYKYVNAPSGLNFRDAPEGNVLGKFPDNLRLQILEVTDITSEIQDSGKMVTGNWVKVRIGRVTGYVFDAFLKEEYREIAYEDNMNELSIFSLSMYYDEEKNYYPFVSLTDDFWSMRFPKVAKEYDEAQNQEETFEEYSFPVKGKDRTRFLSNREIKESDYLYIYNFKLDQLKTFQVKDLMLFSHESIYGGSYLTGFKLKDLINTNEYNYENTFAHIGKENPFEIGKVKTADWQPIDKKQVPKVKIAYNDFFKSSNYEVGIAYHYKLNDNNYYYANLEFLDNKYSGAFIFVISNSGKLIYNTEITSGESHSPTFYIGNLNSKSRELAHYIGELFKNKPPVIFGLYSISFGCPFIDFIDPIEKSVYIQCDNRH